MSKQQQNSTADGVAQELRQVLVSKLKFSPTNPRRQPNKQADEELRESIRRHGIIQPPVVRPMRTKNQDLEVVVGERRVRVAIALHLVEIWVIVRTLTTEQVRELQLVENAQRQDLNPYDQGRAYARLMSECGYSAKKIAEAVSKSVEHVYELLKLVDLEPTVLKAFLDPKHPLRKGHAIEIARLQPADQIRALKQWSSHYQPSVPDLRQWIAREIHRRLDATPWKKTDGKLVPEAGPCTTCPKRAGNNPEFYRGVKPDTCMDRACYEAKCRAWLNAQPATMPRISQDSWSRKQPKGVYGGQQFHEITGKRDRCPSAQPGVVIDGHRRGALIQVCVDPQCTKHGSGDYKPTAAQAARLQKEREQEQRELEIRRRMLDQIAARVPNVLGQRELLIIATVFVDRAEVPNLGHMCQQFDLLQGREEAPSYDERAEAVIEHLRTLTAPELGKALAGWALQHWQRAPWSGPDRLVEAAQTYGVDIERIRREVVGEHKKQSRKPPRRDLRTSAKPAPVEAKPQPPAKNFVERMRQAKEADDGRVIIGEHESAIQDLEESLAFEPTVGENASGFGYRGFSTVQPREWKAVLKRAHAKDVAAAKQLEELIQQGKDFEPIFETLHQAELARRDLRTSANPTAETGSAAAAAAAV